MNYYGQLWSITGIRFLNVNCKLSTLLGVLVVVATTVVVTASSITSGIASSVGAASGAAVALGSQDVAQRCLVLESALLTVHGTLDALHQIAEGEDAFLLQGLRGELLTLRVLRVAPPPMPDAALQNIVKLF